MKRRFPFRELFDRACERRTFLGLLGRIAAGTGLLSIGPVARVAARAVREKEAVTGGRRWGYAIDIEKCIGCGKCVAACKNENDVPREPFYFRTWVERYRVNAGGEARIDSPNGGMDGFPPGGGKDRGVKSFFVPKICNLCDNSPCIQVCPVGATFKSVDGVILIDRQYCIGCRYCIQACPYGTRYFHPVLKVADKCSLCYHRISRGLRPACVEVCPTGARMYGDLNDPRSPLNAFLAANKVGVLKEHLGTKPRTFYKGLDRSVH